MDADVRVSGDRQVPAWTRDRLLGRDAELSEVTALLRTHRLVTVTGVGGVGKTSLATAVVDHWADGAVGGPSSTAACLLARYGTPDQVTSALAASLGQPTWAAALATVPERSVLLLVDNCEHLLDAVADAVEVLLAQCPRVRVLATSREPLAVTGERVLPLDPLPVGPPGPDPDAAARSPAVTLFLARAAEAGAPLDAGPDTLLAVGELCRRLDGLPLAIELAAARTRTMAPEEILGQLDRRLQLLVAHRRAPDRHRTLEAMVDSSYERLDPALQRFYNRLGAAEGLFTAEAAHAVAAEPGQDLVDVLDHLDQLVAQSLVQAHRRGARTWFGLLETLRAYARARLDEVGERDAVTTRCVDWTVRQCVELRERSHRSWSPEFTSVEETVRLDVHDALRHVLTTDEAPDRAFPLLTLLWDADVHNGRAAGTAAVGEQVLARWPDRTHPGWPEAAAVVATAHVVRGDPRRAVELADRVLHTRPAPLASVIALRALFLVALADEAPARALGLVEDAVSCADAAGLRPWAAELRSLRAIALAAADRVQEGLEEVAGAERAAVSSGSPLLAAWCTLVRGHLLVRADPVAARTVLTPLAGSSSVPAQADRRPPLHAEATGAHEPLDLALAHRAVAVLDLAAGDVRNAATGLRVALDTLVRLGEAHVGTTARWVAAAARAAGLADDAADLDRMATTLPAAELSDRLSRVTLERVLPLATSWTEPTTTTRAVVAAARALLDRLDRLDRLDQPAVVRRPDETVTAVPGPPSPPSEQAEFRLVGSVWTLTFEGTTVLLPDLKGLHDLAVLLRAPGKEVRCVDLMGAAVEEPDTGPVLDQQARRSYEQRIVELQSDLVDAEDAGDQGRADRSRMEMDFLVDQLLAASGRTGRTRRTGGTAEKARSAVGWRVRAAIGRVAQAHPALGQHLREAVRLGAWCCYAPVEPVQWRT